MTTTADLLDEYAQALRGAWGDIDGRGEKIALNTLSEAMRTHGTSSLYPSEVKRLREALDVCDKGLGHWTEFCGDHGAYHTEES